MSPISVLLVDDNPTFLPIATYFLQEHDDLVVGTVRDGEEALDQAPNLWPQLILIDLDMPGLPGLETIKRLRIVLPEVGIIALTLLDSNGYRQAALVAGADDFVSKINLGTDLLPAIRRVVQPSGPDKPRAKEDGQKGPRVDVGGHELETMSLAKVWNLGRA